MVTMVTLCSTKDSKFAENEESMTFVNHTNKRSAITVSI